MDVAARIDPVSYVASYAGIWSWFCSPQPLNRPETSLARDGALLVKGGNKSLRPFSQYSEKVWQFS